MHSASHPSKEGFASPSTVGCLTGVTTWITSAAPAYSCWNSGWHEWVEFLTKYFFLFGTFLVAAPTWKYSMLWKKKYRKRACVTHRHLQKFFLLPLQSTKQRTSHKPAWNLFAWWTGMKQHCKNWSNKFWKAKHIILADAQKSAAIWNECLFHYGLDTNLCIVYCSQCSSDTSTHEGQK